MTTEPSDIVITPIDALLLVDNTIRVNTEYPMYQIKGNGWETDFYRSFNDALEAANDLLFDLFNRERN